MHLNFNLVVELWSAVPGEEHDALSAEPHSKVLTKYMLEVGIQGLGPTLIVR